MRHLNGEKEQVGGRGTGGERDGRGGNRREIERDGNREMLGIGMGKGIG